MPILGLTDRGPQFREIGVLRKGAEKPERGPGKDLDHFRFDTQDKEALELFKAEYGDKPMAIKVFLPFRAKEENFEAWKEAYTASSLQHRCNGERTVIWQDKAGTYHTKEEEQIDCPGECKQVMRLKVVIPALNRLAFVTVTSTAINDIMAIDSQLDALMGGPKGLQGIPMVLRRTKRKISTPETTKSGERTGKRLRREKSLLSIEPEREWAQLVLEAQRREAMLALSGASIGQRALPAAPANLLISGLVIPDPDDDEDDVDLEAEKIDAIRERLRLQWGPEKKAGEFDRFWEREFGQVETAEALELKLKQRADARKGKAAPVVEAEPPVLEAEVVDAEPEEIDPEISAALDDLEAMRQTLIDQKMKPEEVQAEIVRLLPVKVRDITECTPGQIDEIIAGLNLKLASLRNKAA